MKRIIFLLLLFCSNAFGALTDIKFGRYQIADSQWNVSACLNTTTCQIYSKQPGTMYKIPWFNGTWSWQSGQYVQFGLTGNASYPYEGKVYNSNGTLAGTIGTGKIVNMGPDYFFFVGNDNNTGQLFSGSSGMSNTGGVSWTGALNPTIQQADTYANATYSTVPLSSGQTATSTPSNAGPPAPAPTAIYNNSSGVYVTRAIPTSNNSPSNEGPTNAFDNNPYTKYLNFDKLNAGVTIQLNAGRVVTSFKLTTANDAVERDPTSYKLYGSNDGSTWTLIQQGALSLSDNRFSVSSDIAVTNSTAYVYYFMIFPSIKNNAGNSVQIAEITYYYDANDTTTSTATSNTIVDPTTAAANTLCCGGSAAAFNSNPTNSAKVQAFVNRTTADSQVHIEQIGTQNVVEVNQSGTRNNYVEYYGNGLSNDINIAQTGNATTQANYVDLRVVGNFNSVDLQQTSTGGTKGIFADVSGNNNSLLVQQKDSGSHYAEITLSGGNKNVDVLQQGSAGHMAKVNLSGTPTDLSLTQSGSTQNYYSITHNCTTAGGCAKITVTQGQ
jgi:hypothetical protein